MMESILHSAERWDVFFVSLFIFCCQSSKHRIGAVTQHFIRDALIHVSVIWYCGVHLFRLSLTGERNRVYV